MMNGVDVTLLRKIGNTFFKLVSGPRRLAHSTSGLCGLLIISFLVIVMIVSFFWTPYNPLEFHPGSRLQPPCFKFPFGTDKFGRDVLSRVLVGSQEVILIASSGTCLAILMGTVIGLITGYIGGVCDEVLMRFMDIFMAFPSLLLGLLVLGMLRPGWINVVLVIGVVFSPRVARVARSGVLDARSKEYVEAAKARGENSIYIMAIEIFPNLLAPLGVEFSVRFAFSIFLSASLGFLGVGVQPPTPDWGLMVNEGRDFIQFAPWVVFFPALAIALLVISVNLLSDAVRQLAAGEI